MPKHIDDTWQQHKNTSIRRFGHYSQYDTSIALTSDELKKAAGIKALLERIDAQHYQLKSHRSHAP